MRPRTIIRIKRSVLAAAAGVLLGTGAGWLAAPAHADPGYPQCQTVPWGFLGGQNRTICDGPVRADGSWTRGRIIWVRAHYVPMSGSTSCFGTSYISCNTSTWGGYYQPYLETDNESYPVTADTVLPDEPGHLP